MQQRQVLEQNAVNKETLETIDTALFVLSLESNNPTDHQDYCRRSFHSSGRNVWFDKSFTMLLFPDGRYSNNVEHSCLDATVSVTCVQQTIPMHACTAMCVVQYMHVRMYVCMYECTVIHTAHTYVCYYKLKALRQ